MKKDVLELRKQSNLIAIQTECPQCNDKYLFGIPYAIVPCKKCGITYKTTFKQSMYKKCAGKLQTMLSWNDEVLIKAEEDFYEDVITIRQNHIEMGCWDVSKLSTSNEEYKFCNSCGTCMECFECQDCHEHFKKDDNRRKLKCPKCNSSHVKRSSFTESVPSNKSKNKKMCPFCKTEKIKRTITKQKTKCHKCSSKDLTQPNKKKIFEFTITRKKGYFRDRLE